MLAPAILAYYVLNCVDMLCLGVLILTMLISSQVPRHPTIPNNLVVWFLSSLSSNLLLLTGFVGKDHVPIAFCKIQSAMQYGAPPALAAAALTVVLRVWYLTWSVDNQRAMNFPEDAPWVTIVSVAFPYFIWLVISLITGIMAGDDVLVVLEYCASSNQTLSIISGAASAIITLIAAVFQFWAIAIVWGRYRVSHRLGPLETGSKDTATFIRVTGFFVLIVGGLILSIVATVSAWSQIAPDLTLASIGFGLFLVFGTQRDVLVVWRLLKRTDSYRSDGSGLRSFGSARHIGSTNRDILSQHRHKLAQRPQKPPSPATSTESFEMKGARIAEEDEEDLPHHPNGGIAVEVNVTYDRDYSRPATPTKGDVELHEVPMSPKEHRRSSSQGEGKAFSVVAYSPHSPHSPHSPRS